MISPRLLRDFAIARANDCYLNARRRRLPRHPHRIYGPLPSEAWCERMGRDWGLMMSALLDSPHYRGAFVQSRVD